MPISSSTQKETLEQRLILEFTVHDAVLQSGLLNFLAGVPFVGVLMMALFRLDEIIAAPKRAGAVKRRICGRDENGHLFLSDPDGRSWKPRQRPGKAGRVQSR